MEVEYYLTLDDAVAYSSYHYYHTNKLLKRIIRIVYAVLGFSAIFLGILIILGGSTSAGVPGIIFGIFFLVYSFYWRSPSGIRKRIQNQLSKWYAKTPNDVICKHKFLISSEGVTDITDLGQSTNQWTMIEKIISTDKYIFLTMTGGAKVHIVPKSAFLNDKVTEQFIVEAKKYQNEAA